MLNRKISSGLRHQRTSAAPSSRPYPCPYPAAGHPLARRPSKPLTAAATDGEKDETKGNIVQETFAAFTSDKEGLMTTRSILGDDNAQRISQALGADSFAKVESILDKLLANRRAITLASALLDVALIIAGIKAFQSFNSSE